MEWKVCICSYCDYFDCHVKDVNDWQLLFDALRKMYPHYRIAVRNLRDDIVKKLPALNVLYTEKYHILDIREDIDAIWDKTHASFKSPVKQAQKFDLTIKRCAKSELPKFYNLHLNLRKNKYRLFPQPYRFFDNVWDQYVAQDKGVLLGAYDKSADLIAANFYLICDRTLYYKFSTSKLQALSLRPNNLLFWEGIKFAKERNLEYIDLGSSGLEQKGLIMYKDHTGARSQDITHLGFAPAGYKFSEKRILKTITALLTMRFVPNVFLRLGSNIMYPYLA